MIWPMLSNGTAKTSCSTNASRAVGVRLSSTISSARPIDSATMAWSSGPSAAGSAISGSGSHMPAWSSRCARRALSMSRQMRPTTVVSQARRSPISLVLLRRRRSQDSCTASSASLTDPSML